MVNVRVSQEKTRSIAQISRDRTKLRKQKVKAQEQQDAQSQKKYETTLTELKSSEDKIIKAIQQNRELPKITKSIRDPYYSAFKEQQEHYQTEYEKIKNTTASGKNISELKKQTDKYNVSYYSDGSVKSIKSKPQTYIDDYTKKKKNGKKKVDEKKSNYVDYELNFNSDGTIRQEIERGIYLKEHDYDKRSSGYRKELDNEVYTKFSAQYKDGKPAVVQEFGIVEKKDKDDKDGDRLKQSEVFLEEKSTFDTTGKLKTYQKQSVFTDIDKKTDKYKKELKDTYVSESWDSTSRNLIKYGKPTTKGILIVSKEKTEAPTTKTSKLTVTPSNLFGTANNILKPGETEIRVNKQTGKRYTSYEKSIPETISKLTGLTVLEVKKLRKEDPKMLSKVVDDVLEKKVTGKVKSQKSYKEILSQQKAAKEATEKAALWQENVIIADSLLGKQDKRKEVLKTSDSYMKSYVDIKTGHPKAAPIWEQKTSFGAKLLKTGEKLISEGRQIEKDKTQSFLKGEKPKKGLFVSGEVRMVAGEVLKDTGYLIEATKGIKKAPEAFYNIQTKAVGLIDDAVSLYKRTGMVPSAGSPSTAVKGASKEIATGATVLGVSAFQYAQQDIKVSAGSGLRTKAGAFIIETAIASKGINIIGKKIGSIITKADDIYAAKLLKKAPGTVSVETIPGISLIDDTGKVANVLDDSVTIKGKVVKPGVKDILKNNRLLASKKAQIKNPAKRKISKAQLRKNTYNQAYDPRITRTSDSVIIKGKKGKQIEFRQGEIKGAVKEPRGLSDRFKKEITYKVTPEGFQLKSRELISVQGSKARQSKLYPKNYGIPQKPKSEGIRVSASFIDQNLGKSTILYKQKLSKGMFEITFDKRYARPTSNTILRNTNKPIQDFKSGALESTKKIKQSVPKLQQEQITEIKGFRSGKSSQKLFERLEKLKQDRAIQKSTYKQYIEKSPYKNYDYKQNQNYPVVYSAPAKPTIVDARESFRSSIKAINTPSSRFAPTKKKRFSYSGQTPRAETPTSASLLYLYGAKGLSFRTNQELNNEINAKDVGFDFKTNDLTKDDNKIEQIRDIKPIIDSTQLIDNDNISDNIIKTEVMVESDSDIKSDTEIDYKYDTVIKSKFAFDLKLREPTVPTKITQQPPRQPEPIKPYEPRRPPKPTIRVPRNIFDPEPIEQKPVKIPRFGISLSSKQKKGLFDVEVRRKGEFQSVRSRGFSSLQRAFESGVKETKESAAASFRIKERRTGKVLTGFGNKLSKEYRLSKKDSGIIVQRRSFRISSAGEKQQITKKGLFAIKLKKNKGLFAR